MNIIQFKFKNFRSYREEMAVDFSAIESDYLVENLFGVQNIEEKTPRNLLKTIAVFGPNASGKSNIIWAFQAFRFFVLESRKFAVNDRLPYEPFGLDENSKNSDTIFNMTFFSEGITYEYVFSYNAMGFTYESLKCHVMHSTYIREIFTRDKDGNIQTDDELLFKTISSHASNNKILSNHLLLSESAIWEANTLQLPYMAISNIIVEPINGNINLKGNAMLVADQILKDNSSSITKQLSALISMSDVGIQSMRIIPHGEKDFILPDSMSEDVKKQIISQNRWEFRFGHKNRDNSITEFQIDKESTGTQHLFTLGAILLKVLQTGSVFAIDEMNLAMHPHLFRFLIQLFHDERSNPNNAQLIFTTHDTTIVSENEMRADQIWFTQKNEYGESELYSAQDFDDMKINVPFEKWYRAGRFGALPNPQKLFNLFSHGKE